MAQMISKITGNGVIIWDVDHPPFVKDENGSNIATSLNAMVRGRAIYLQYDKEGFHVKDAFSIEIDCAPGGLRPDDLLPGVLEGTGIELGETISRSFGNWTWEIPYSQADQYEAVRDTVKSRLEELYNSHRCRYASW